MSSNGHTCPGPDPPLAPASGRDRYVRPGCQTERLIDISTRPAEEKCPNTRVQHSGQGATDRRDGVPSSRHFRDRRPSFARRNRASRVVEAGYPIRRSRANDEFEVGQLPATSLVDLSSTGGLVGRRARSLAGGASGSGRGRPR